MVEAASSRFLGEDAARCRVYFAEFRHGPKSRPLAPGPASDAVYCTMRVKLTISLPPELRRSLDKTARAEGVTASEVVRGSLRAARGSSVPKAPAAGSYTDEDVS